VCIGADEETSGEVLETDRDASSFRAGRLRCDHHGMTEHEEFITWVQSVLREAEIAVHNGDAGPRRAIWSRKDPVTVLGAWKNASGQQELDELFDHLADSFSDCTSYEFELLEAEVRGDTAYTVGFEHTSASVNGVPRTYTLRATQIYRREDGAWRVAHRHGSAPPE
jgi:ketosteroid isomerase-like protein